MPEQNTETLVAPEFMVEGPNGSVIADPSKIPAPTTTPEKVTSERPEWLDEKFKTPADLAAAYKELEKKLGAPKTETKTETKPAEQTLTPEQVAEKGFDMKQLQAEYAEKGDITPETRAKLAEKGITGEAVDQYIAGVKATNERVRSEFATLAGGDEQLTSVLEWAKTNLSKEEADGYDALLESGNHAAAKMAFQGIVSRFNAEHGETPSLVTTERVPSTPGVKPFESREQMMKEMNKPEYAKDPAFRAKVEQRLMVTTAF